jgi:arginyl-tRNA synthetase
MKKICQFPRLIEISALNFEPHRLAFFLSEIAADFHALWNYGSENIEAKFVIEDNIEITSARIYLVKATKKIIAEILTIFSVQPLSEM